LRRPKLSNSEVVAPDDEEEEEEEEEVFLAMYFKTHVAFLLKVRLNLLS